MRPPLRRTYTEHVVTRWYRAPELVLLQPYNQAVDVYRSPAPPLLREFAEEQESGGEKERVCA